MDNRSVSGPGPSGSVSAQVQPRRSSSGRISPLTRRTSTQERIDSILQTAVERAESIEASGQRPHLAAMRTKSSGTGIPEESSQGPTETTGIFTNAAPINYQSTETTSSTRERRSATSSDFGHIQPHFQAQMRPSHNDAVERDESEPEPEEQSNIRSFLSQFKSIELENKGATARDHLALERTFLAWLRTSLAFASIGIAITQLFRLNTSIANREGNSSDSWKSLRQLGKPLGSTFLGISIAILLLGYRRYFQSQQWILRGKFPASRGTIILVAFMAFAIMITSLVVVVVVGPGMKDV